MSEDTFDMKATDFDFDRWRQVTKVPRSVMDRLYWRVRLWLGEVISGLPGIIRFELNFWSSDVSLVTIVIEDMENVVCHNAVEMSVGAVLVVAEEEIVVDELSSAAVFVHSSLDGSDTVNVYVHRFNKISEFEIIRMSGGDVYVIDEVRK